ncbi:hypothetical protein P152DRAFT_400782 [Eremomyces bilateralis CBS 781.70]|uniref:Uncharacterized protein n=1 Tax=Eremomyces bilateralis CBS 781.70 TaxID=1392243 RepID=A0A6G1FYD5_9PEZI|nr:uncharacterized protein P152DRAFT_400782 [Eremomyces bilateralis CBS 781.70]KAF1810686.1 hypothetical protein P152DRAFT_400782 [Eremomyces bilateralis CBS 781.70]
MKTAEISQHRAKISIPANVPSEEYARQCIFAASWSRLNPYALHPGEYRMLRQYITGPQVTTYVNIRNGILRLWVRNPMVCVSIEEAAGCAKESRFFGLAYTAHEWLIRNGYINFGCVRSQSPSVPARLKPSKPRETIAIIGAGMAGLACARQLENLFEHFSEHWYKRGEFPPKVTILEGRNRIGGRIYSFPLHATANGTHPPGSRCTAEMGAQIVTGFERGNPLNAIIRGQLGLHMHAIKEGTVLYDIDGSTVDKQTDDRVEGLFNDVLERASKFRNQAVQALTLEGDIKLIEAGKDPTTDGGEFISVLESRGEPVNVVASQGRPKKNRQTNAPVTMEKLTGRSYQATETKDLLAAAAAEKLGFNLTAGVSKLSTLQLEQKAQEHMSNLGDVMDEACRQYQDMMNLTEQDLRLLNWHYANLEYASAAPVGSLSLTGWDQDSGNEFEGEHTEVIGGYTQVPRGLYLFPTPLDVKLGRCVETIEYHASTATTEGCATVTCSDGESIRADRVVLTAPLGVLKAGTIKFEPQLPDWKLDCIDRMGFGLLNKLVLVYDTPFWEQDRDMFGLLHESIIPQSRNMKDYAAQRGLFYIFWNTMKTSGAPTLVAMMAGNSAYAVENVTDAQLVDEAQTSLSKIFGQIPKPKETVITRWRKDPFARGSYSYVGPNTRSDDYENMATSVGQIHFAGEATCGTHPATVHGAYLSGLRAACEVIETFIGPMDPGQPLVGTKLRQSSTDGTPTQAVKRPMADAVQIPERQSRAEMNKAWENGLNQKIQDAIGARPLKPIRAGTNPFLLWQRDQWQAAKNKCDDAKRARHPKDLKAKAGKDDIRKELGRSWMGASAEEKKPYYAMTEVAREQSKKWHADFKELIEKWDRDAEVIKKAYTEENPLSEWAVGYGL